MGLRGLRPASFSAMYLSPASFEALDRACQFMWRVKGATSVSLIAGGAFAFGSSQLLHVLLLFALLLSDVCVQRMAPADPSY